MTESNWEINISINKNENQQQQNSKKAGTMKQWGWRVSSTVVELMRFIGAGSEKQRLKTKIVQNLKNTTTSTHQHESTIKSNPKAKNETHATCTIQRKNSQRRRTRVRRRTRRKCAKKQIQEELVTEWKSRKEGMSLPIHWCVAVEQEAEPQGTKKERHESVYRDNKHNLQSVCDDGKWTDEAEARKTQPAERKQEHHQLCLHSCCDYEWFDNE